MDWDILKTSLIVSAYRTLYGVFSIFIVIFLLLLFDKYILTRIDTIGELKNRNTAVAIVVAGTIVAISIIIGLASL